ncbi:MAG TPA: flagellar hook-basal body complex protein FliE [Sedimentisphaerales bacterium]|nr:flagellar hook-basal body complex protein FliE [Sedimentisphaerales bacterium]
MINLNANITSSLPKIDAESFRASKLAPRGLGESGGVKVDFENAVKAAGKYLSGVSDLQQSSNASIMDLLAGKNTDITSVVAAAAKADMSFKLLVGVRNQLIEAYKQTMNMQI